MALHALIALAAGLPALSAPDLPVHQVPAHQVEVVHDAQAHAVRYHAAFDTRQRTLGHALGTRPSTERCETTLVARVERHVALDTGEPALVSRLPVSQAWRSSVPGPCRAGSKAAAALAQRNAGAVARLLVDAAETDRAEALAAIQAAHVLARR